MNVRDLKGQIIGQYELTERLGAGGMGVVYRAWQRNLEREVAFKVLSLEANTDPEMAKRFIREAHTIARLEHPHIVAVHDYGTHTFEDDSQLSYIVMRLLTGGSLADRLSQNQPLPFSEITRLTQQIASALAYAHSKGIIHRDIKPSNVMFDQHNTTLLVDFGIAKPQNARSQITAAGQTIGTPEYMSPDQWGTEPVNDSSDQYSLAVMVYEMLSGHLPFEAPDIRMLLRKVLYEPPTPIHQYRTDLPDAVASVLNRALSKEPNERYPTITDFAQDLTQAFSPETRIHVNPVRTDTVVGQNVAPVPDVPTSDLGRGEGMVQSPLPAAPSSTEPSKKTQPSPQAKLNLTYVIALIVVAVLLVAGITLLPSLLGNTANSTEPTEVIDEPSPTSTSTVTSTPTITVTSTHTSTPTPTNTEQPSPTATDEPTPEILAPADAVGLAMRNIQSVCVVTDVGRINDGTFNQFAFEGMVRAAEEFGLESTFIETQAQTDYETNVNVCVNEGYDVIVTVGFLIADATLRVAQANPNTFFIGVDQFVAEGPQNYVGIQFREDQAGFLVGAMAALMTQSGTIAGIYGIDIPPVVKFRHGYEQGARYINPDINVLGVYIDSFTAPDRGAAAAEQFIGEGADVIFGAGGPTGSGAIVFAASEGVWVIGVDQDEYFTTFGGGETPGADRLITSAVKRVDNGVYQLIEILVEGNMSAWNGGGNHILEVNGNGIGVAAPHDAAVPAAVTNRVNEILAGLQDGSIQTGVDPTTGALLEP